MLLNKLPTADGKIACKTLLKSLKAFKVGRPFKQTYKLGKYLFSLCRIDITLGARSTLAR